MRDLNGLVFPQAWVVESTANETHHQGCYPVVSPRLLHTSSKFNENTTKDQHENQAKTPRRRGARQLSSATASLSSSQSSGNSNALASINQNYGNVSDQYSSVSRDSNPGDRAPVEVFYAASYNRKWWLSVENQRVFYEYLAKKLNIQTDEDWYQVSKAQIVEAGGSTWLNLNRRHIYYALKQVKPSVPWQSWRFVEWRLPPNWWTPQNTRDFLEAVAPLIGVKNLEDWYGIVPNELEKYGGALRTRSLG